MPNLNHRLDSAQTRDKKMQKSGIFRKIKTAITNGGLDSALIALAIVLIAAPAMAAPASNAGLCQLIARFQDVFKLLRTLAFVGAGFILAKYGWEAITSGKIGGKDNVAEGLKAIGVPMIIGVALLFSIGILLTFLSNGENFGCPNLTTGW